MESYGKLLRTYREARNLDIETVERDISIPRHYIEAFEMEDFDKFPGETYFNGFLRTYAEYLGLDPEQLMMLFRAKRIQESPIPRELLKRGKPRILFVLLILGILIVFGGITVAIIHFLKPLLSEGDGTGLVEDNTSGHVYTLSKDPFQKRIYTGDLIIVPVAVPAPVSGQVPVEGERQELEPDNDTIKIEVTGTLSVLSLKTPMGEQLIELGEEIELDIDGKPGSEIIVFVSDISPTDASNGAEVRILLKTVIDSLSSSGEPIAAKTTNTRSSILAVILEDTRAYPFTLRTTFRDVCVFRYQADNRERTENFFSNNELMTLQANNGIRLWISNINSVKMQIIADGKDFDIEADKNAHIACRDIKWIRTPSGSFQLVVIDVD